MAPKLAKIEAPAPIETEDDVQTQLDLLRCFVRDKSIDPDRVYTVDKMQLHWRALPLKGSSSPATAAATDCIEVLVCMNSTGTHRLRLALIVRGKGNAINDSICDDVNASALPFRHYSCAQAFDADTFAEWFREEFVSAVSWTSRPALLLVGAFWLGGNSLLQTDDGNVRCVVLSSATVFLTQPASQHLQEKLRCGYRKALLSRVIVTHQLQQHPGLASNSASLLAWRSVTLKDAGYMLNETWLALRVDSLRSFWRDTYSCVGVIDTTISENEDEEDKKPDGCPSTNQLEVSALNVTSLLSEASEMAAALKDVFADEVNLDRVTNWLLMDASQHADDFPAQGSVVDVAKKGENGIDSSSRYSLRGNVPNNAEAHACFVKGLAWLERQPNTDSKDLQTLWKLQRISAEAAAASRRRKSDKT